MKENSNGSEPTTENDSLKILRTFQSDFNSAVGGVKAEQNHLPDAPKEERAQSPFEPTIISGTEENIPLLAQEQAIVPELDPIQGQQLSQDPYEILSIDKSISSTGPIQEKKVPYPPTPDKKDISLPGLPETLSKKAPPKIPKEQAHTYQSKQQAPDVPKSANTDKKLISDFHTTAESSSKTADITHIEGFPEIKKPTGEVKEVEMSKETTQQQKSTSTDKYVSVLRTAEDDIQKKVTKSGVNSVEKDTYLKQQNQKSDAKKVMQKDVSNLYKQYSDIQQEKKAFQDNTDPQAKKAQQFSLQKKQHDLKTHGDILTEKQYAIRWNPPQEKNSSSSLYLILAFLILLISVGGIAFGVFFYKTKPGVEIVPPMDTPPVATDDILNASLVEIADISVSDDLLYNGIRKIQKVDVLARIIPQQNKKRLSGYQFLQKYTQAPELLLDTVKESFFLGTLQTKRNKGLVLLLSIEDYANSYRGILSWEENKKLVENIERLAGTSTDEPLVPPSAVSRSGFTDSTVENVTVREIYDTSQKLRLVYGFLSSNTLLIATTKESFQETIRLIRAKVGGLFLE